MSDRHRGGRSLVILIVAVVSLSLFMLGAADDEFGDDSAKPAVEAEKSVDKTERIEVTPPGEVYNQRERLLVRGKRVYDRYCVGCHGEKGDGKGPAAARLITQPRDFTGGIYKFRSTDSSSLPMEADIHRTIARGLSRVSMPAFPLMPEQDKTALVQYLKSFYPNWDAERNDRKVVFVPPAPADLMAPERVGRGRVVYLAMGCGNCHGKDGAGTGAGQTEFTDAWGNPQGAFNFTRGRLKSGDDPEDVYRVFHTGLRSIMPQYGGDLLSYVGQEQVMTQQSMMLAGEPESLKAFLEQFPESAGEVAKLSAKDRAERVQRNSWDLVAYVMSLRGGGGVKSVPIVPAPKTGSPTPKKKSADEEELEKLFE